MRLEALGRGEAAPLDRAPGALRNQDGSLRDGKVTGQGVRIRSADWAATADLRLRGGGELECLTTVQAWPRRAMRKPMHPNPSLCTRSHRHFGTHRLGEPDDGAGQGARGCDERCRRTEGSQGCGGDRSKRAHTTTRHDMSASVNDSRIIHLTFHRSLRVVLRPGHQPARASRNNPTRKGWSRAPEGGPARVPLMRLSKQCHCTFIGLFNAQGDC